MCDAVERHEELQDRLREAEQLQKKGDLEGANEVYQCWHSRKRWMTS